jgi:16S rRNA (guanine966-N2)-methyltransferase
MRVIAGTAKGVRLAPVPRGIRPVSDMAREGLFSSITSAVPGAAVLDLYAGTGAMGIEALSRGAEAVTFVERSPQARATVLQNLNRTRLADRARIVPSPVAAFLSGDDSWRGSFDLVLVDPPYEARGAEVDSVLAELGSGWLPEHGWTVALTRSVRSSIPVIPVHWHVARRLEYGDTLVLVYREV